MFVIVEEGSLMPKVAYFRSWLGAEGRRGEHAGLHAAFIVKWVAYKISHAIHVRYVVVVASPVGRLRGENIFSNITNLLKYMQFKTLFLPLSALPALLGSFTHISLLTLIIKVLFISHAFGIHIIYIVSLPLLFLSQ